MIEEYPNIVKMLERAAVEMKSARQTTMELYRASLKVWCPDYAKKIKTAKTNFAFLATIKDMEDDIKESLTKRDVKRVVVSAYLNGCFQEVVIGVENGSTKITSIEKRGEILARVQKGESPEEARKAILGRRERSLVSNTYFVFRPINRGESTKVYLAEASLKWSEFLKANGITAIVEMRLAKPERKPATKNPAKPVQSQTWYK
jgi:hypothetical protein